MRQLARSFTRWLARTIFHYCTDFSFCSGALLYTFRLLNMTLVRRFAAIAAYLSLPVTAQTPFDFPVQTLAGLGVSFSQFSVSPPGTLAPSLQSKRIATKLHCVLTHQYSRLPSADHHDPTIHAHERYRPI